MFVVVLVIWCSIWLICVGDIWYLFVSIVLIGLMGWLGISWYVCSVMLMWLVCVNVVSVLLKWCLLI